jgi:arginase family enzyme
MIEEYIRKGKIVIALGGGHDVTYPLAKGFHAGIDKDFSLVNIDAHLDVREKKNGLHHSGSSFRLLIEDGDLKGKNFTEFGIQPFSYSKEHYDWAISQGSKVEFFPKSSADFGSLISDVKIPLYVSFDIDSIRSSDAPGCSAPSPMGFTSEDAIAICFEAGKHSQTRMLDIVEVSPPFDIDEKTSRLAARMIAAFLAGIANRSSS